MAEIYANNVRGKLAQPILAADTSITLQPGHNFLDPGSNWYRATLFRWEFTSEGIREFDHEVVKVTALAGDVLTVERELEGVALAFDPDAPIELRMTAGTAAAIESRAGQALADHSQASHPHSQYAKEADLGEAAGREVVGGDGALMVQGFNGFGGLVVDATNINELSGTQLRRQRSDDANAFRGTAGHLLHWERVAGGVSSQLIVTDTGELGVRARGGTGEWTAPARFYSDKNVVGTVSQANGKPTGALFERGANANGEYVKLPDGTLILYFPRQTVSVSTAEGAGYTSAQVVLSYPYQPSNLVSSNGVSSSVSGTGAFLSHRVGSVGVVFEVKSLVNKGTMVFDAVLVGRWY